MKYFSKVQSIEEAKALYKKLAFSNHPDKGGDTETMQEINAEFELAFSFLKHRSSTPIDKEDTANKFTRTFYTSNGWEGSRYDYNLRNKDITKIMREYVKSVYPTWKFSIRMSGYSSISISIMEAPINIFTDKADDKNRKHHSINHYFMKEDDNITEYCQMVLKDVYDMLLSYNYDDSDISTDYFNTNFYVNLAIGKWDKPFKVVEKTARINTNEEVFGAKRISDK